MAHDDAVRAKVRAAYVFDQLSLESSADAAEVPLPTARRWKRDARLAGDDWDKARASQMLAGGDMESIMRQALAAAMQQMQTIMTQLQEDDETPAAEKAKLLASLSDSFSKFMTLAKRTMPETDKLGVAMDVIRRLDAHLREHHPQHAGPFAELLPAFGQELARAYG